MKAAVSLIAALASTLLTTAPAQSRTWRVMPDGTGDAPTIQAAIDSAQAGDEVLLAPGTYSWTTQGTSLDKFGGSMIEIKAGVSLRGEEGPESTILDAEGYGRVILCQDVGEIRIEGLTVTGGARISTSSETSNGGGICSLGNSRPTISNCIVRENYIDTGGGGDGAGIYAEQATIIDCEIFGNSCHDSGGGIYILQGSVSECIIRNNGLYLGQGGGAGICAGQASITNCEIFDNSGGPGVFSGGGISGGSSVSGCTIRNNRVFGDFQVSAGGINSGANISDCRIEGNSAWSGYYDVIGGGSVLYNGSMSRCSLFDSDIVCSGNSISNCIFGGSATITNCTLVASSINGGSVSSSILANTTCSGPITFSCTNVYSNSLGDSLCGTDAGGNFSADPQFCAEDPATSLNFALQADSPCAPGNHPDGISCGLIGAAPVGCGTVSVMPTTWSRLKSLYR